VFGREHPEHVRTVVRDAVAAERAEAARYGVRLWHPADPADHRCADAVRAIAEQVELPPAPGVTRAHAHAVATGAGVLGHHFGTTLLPPLPPVRHFLVQHLATPELVGSLHDSSVPDYRLDGATGLHHQGSDPRYPATTYDPLESLETTFAAPDPATSAELAEILRGQGGSGVDLARSLHQRHGIPSLFASGSGHRARQASDVALGLLSKPYDARGVVMAVEAMGAILSGGTPARLPHGLEVFHAPVPAASV